MNLLFSLTVGLLFAGAVYLMLKEDMFRRVIGLALLAHGTNLLIFTAAGVDRGRPPLVHEGSVALAAGAADPLPQALILTAIVIGFGITAFALAVTLRVEGRDGETT